MNGYQSAQVLSRFMILLFVVSLGARADASRLEELSPGAKPVPPDLLSGTTLIVPAHGFAVSAPSSAWTWYVGQVPEKHADFKVRFLAFNLESERFIEVQAIRLEFPALDDQNVRALLTQMLTNVAGAQASSLQYSLVPNRPDAYRYSYDVEDAGERTAVQGAVIRANRLFMLTMATLDSDEIATFEALLESFKLVDTKDQAPPVAVQSLATTGTPRSRLSGSTFYPLITILVLLVTSAVKDRRGIARRNPGSVALVALALIVPFGIIVAIDPSSSDPLHVSSTIGEHFGSALVGVAIAVYVFRRHRRRLSEASLDVAAPVA